MIAKNKKCILNTAIPSDVCFPFVHNDHFGENKKIIKNLTVKGETVEDGKQTCKGHEN